MKVKHLLGEFSDLEKEKLDWKGYTIKEALQPNLFPADKILIERYQSGTIFE